MTLEQKYKQKYEIGFPIFEKLFQLKKDNFIKVMKDIFQEDKSVLEILENKPKILKTLVDDEPERIEFYYYDAIEIDHTGVNYKPEHGASIKILNFDKFFNIDVALRDL